MYTGIRVKPEPGSPPKGMNDMDTFLTTKNNPETISTYKFVCRTFPDLKIVKQENMSMNSVPPKHPNPQIGFPPIEAPINTAAAPPALSHSQLRSIMNKFAEKLGSKLDEIGVPESRKRAWIEAFEAESAARFNINRNSEPVPNPGPSTQISAIAVPAQAPVNIPIAEPKQKPIAVSAEPVRKKPKLSNTAAPLIMPQIRPAQGQRKNQLLSAVPPNRKPNRPSQVIQPLVRRSSIRFFECPTCCQQFSAKQSAHQHFGTCSKPFDSQANNARYLS